MAATRASVTIEAFRRLADDGMLHELDEGEVLSMPPASEQHGDVEGEVFAIIRSFARQHSLGRVYPSDTGFLLSDGTVRSPDVAFVKKQRLAGLDRSGFFPGAPDLAVEVFSPSDSVAGLMRKVRQYFRAGCHTVWIVYPATKEVQVLDASGNDRTLQGEQLLEAPELLPGFSIPAGKLFETD